MIAPTWLDPKIHRFVDRHIIRAGKQPQLWHPDLLPINRLFYFYGQPSSGLEEATVQYLQSLKIEFAEITVSRDAKVLEQELSRQFNPPMPILVLRNGHMLKYHRDLFLKTLYLKDLTSYLFIIVLGNEIPDEEHPFYEQFDKLMVSGLPTRDFCEELIRFYFKSWSQHWKHSSVNLGDEDYRFLAISCDFCTPGDIEKFVQRVFTHVVDRYPEDNVDVNLSLCQEFMHPLNHQTGVYCITDREARKAQAKYDPDTIGSTEAPTEIEKPERKRSRTEVFIE